MAQLEAAEETVVKNFVIVVIALILLVGCGNKTKTRAILTRPGQNIWTGIDYPTITETVRNAQAGDTVWVVRHPDAYSTKNGEQFPILVPAGVTIKAYGAGAAPYAMIDMDSPNQLSVFEVGNGTRFEGLTITSSTGKVPQVASLQGVSDITFIECEIRTPGFPSQGLKRILFERCVFKIDPIYNSQYGAIAISMAYSEDVTIRRSTFSSYEKFIVIGTSVRVLIEENIIVNGHTGIEIDDASLPYTTIQYNDVWSNGNFGYPANFRNTTSKAVFTPSGPGNISENPRFLDPSSWLFNILGSSPAAIAGSTGGPIGARGVVGEITLTLQISSPSGIAPRKAGTEVMRFSMTTGLNKTVEFGPGSGIAVEVEATGAIPQGTLEIIEVTSGKTVFSDDHWGSSVRSGLYLIAPRAPGTYSIVPGTTQDFKVVIDTSVFNANNTLRVTVNSPYSTMGTVKVYNPTVTGNALSF